MPLTQFPNGVSTRTFASTNSAAGDNDLTCLDLFVDGTATITGGVSVSGVLASSSTAGLTGQLASLVFTFGTASAVQVTSLPVPFAGNLEAVYVVMGSVSAVVASYTVQIGSAGAVAVATVANATASVGVQQSLAVTSTSFAITNGLVCTRSVQGTAGDTALIVVIRKTA